MSGTWLGRAAFHCYPVPKVVEGGILFLRAGGNGGRGRHKKKIIFIDGDSAEVAGLQCHMK